MPSKMKTTTTADKPTHKAEIPIKPSNPAVIDDTPAPTTTAPKKSNTPVVTTPPKDDEEKKTNDDGAHFDITQHVYGGIKNVWGFGSNIIVVKPFLKLTEGVAGTVLGLTTGLKLENVDEGINSSLAGLDNGLINPVIGSVVNLVMPIFETGENIVKGTVPVLLGPFGFGRGVRSVPAIDVGGAPTTEMKKKEEKKPVVEKKEEEGDEVSSTPEMTPIRNIPVQ